MADMIVGNTIVVPEETTRLAAKFRKKIPGYPGHPQCMIDLMWKDYQRLNSCSQVAKLWNMTRQSVWEMFNRRGLKMNAKNLHSVRIHNGVRYTDSGKMGYWRATSGDRNRMLHLEIWKEANGTIPPDHYIGFKDGDKNNCALENLVCLSKADLTKFHYKRLYPSRANWTAEDYRRHKNEIHLRFHQRRAARNLKAGLTHDGKVRRIWRRNVERKQWDFVYKAPVVVKEDCDHKVIRRHVGKFTPKGAVGDLFAEIHADIDARRPKDVYE